MSDLDLLVAGVVVTFLALTGAYVAIRHRANEAPVESYKSSNDSRSVGAVIQPHIDAR